ncbi:unnamed protein product (macronuclear) [Paramecium tetraurelia]|uniref:Uncharacterized protein n=1 Tax=Paramecium tetraurelia TaxID=5888 RepID=A0C5D8_PARTE|nr:uncharacterized protein GSPATT00006504001 [Paramecium tetraurelia]CAK66005.1 unnamed protein product [Paramecium tetraurelia]|eukprot:XP_001433402.1 hypothetical protein (macronuclear) [Paramecium tetraurelia strain d4-2]
MQLLYIKKTGKFKDLIQQQKAQIQDKQKSLQQRLDSIGQLKTTKIQDSKQINQSYTIFRQGSIKQLSLPKLMKRIYSDKRLKDNCQQQQKSEDIIQQSISKDIKSPIKFININNTYDQKSRLAVIASTDRFQTESNERKEFMNYTFGAQFRIRGTNTSNINNNKSSISQKRSASQTSRIMTTTQLRVVNKIFS